MFIWNIVYTFVFGIKSSAFWFLIETRHHVIDVSSKVVPDFLFSLGSIQWLVRIHGGSHPGDSAQVYAGRKPPDPGAWHAKSALHRGDRKAFESNCLKASGSSTDPFSGLIRICQLYASVCVICQNHRDGICVYLHTHTNGTFKKQT